MTPRLSLAAVLLLLAPAPLTLAQAGGGAGGGAGAGAGSGAAGSAGSAGNGVSGAASQGTGAPGAPAGTHGAAPSAQGAQAQAPSVPAAGAAPGTDPRQPPPSSPGALTLRQVVERVRQGNPTLLAAEQNLRAVRAQELQAATRANPYLGLSGNNVTLPANGTEANPYGYSVQLSRLFERGNKRQYRIENARATTQQTAAQLQDATRQTVLAVEQAFTHMLFSKAALSLSQSQLADFRHEVDINRDRFQAGDISQLDFARLDLQLSNFESDEANAQIALRQASDQLQTLMGIATPSESFDITGDIVPPIVTQTKEQLIQTALATRPDVAAARFGTAAAEANSRLAIANGTADPTVEGEYDRSGTYNSAGFNVNIPIRLFDRNQGNKQTAALEIESARLTETATRNQVVSDVDQAWVGYARARALSDRYTEHYLDESSQVLSIARFAYDHGGLALIDYLDALRESRSAISDALNAYSNTWLSIHQLSTSSATDLLP